MVFKIDSDYDCYIILGPVCNVNEIYLNYTYCFSNSGKTSLPPGT